MSHPSRRTRVGGALLALLAFTPGLSSLPAMALELGPLILGGALRANYIQGDYVKDNSGAPQRGGNGGDFELDVFRVNLDYRQDAWLGKAEYRWYNGYNFIHTAWVGYETEDFGRLELGANRVPFGVGAYGPANSWFFDQHYYVGLADAMKLGVKYTRRMDALTLDAAYYAAALPNGQGTSDESVRYSYAVVAEDVYDIPGAYEQEHQINLRSTYALEALHTDVGISAQYAQLKAQDRRAEDSDAYAVAAHTKTTIGPVGVMLQLTSYKYDVDYTTDETGLQPNHGLITMGAFDFAWPVAAEGIIPSAAVSYTIKPDGDWVDAITFYNDFSVIIKDGKLADGRAFKDSAMNVTGMAIAKGGWYIYVDYAISSGNYFVGNEGDDYGDGLRYSSASVGDFGANQNDDWKGRFNINFGYYF